MHHLFFKILVDEWFKGLLGHHMLVCPKKQHPGSGCHGFPTRIIIISPWFSNFPGPKISIRDPPALAFDTDPNPWSFSTMVESKKSALVGNRWRTPPGSSDTDPDPWSPLQAPLPGTCPSTNQTEGVTTDLDPVRNHLEESSGQFRQGLTCFLIIVYIY